MSKLPYTVTIERADNMELEKLVKFLDVWCMQHYGRPGPSNLWNRNRNRLYDKKMPKKRGKIYHTIYSFKESEYAFEFKLSNMGV